MKQTTFLVVDDNSVALQELGDTLRYLGYKDVHAVKKASYYVRPEKVAALYLRAGMFTRVFYFLLNSVISGRPVSIQCGVLSRALSYGISGRWGALTFMPALIASWVRVANVAPVSPISSRAALTARVRALAGRLRNAGG